MSEMIAHAPSLFDLDRPPETVQVSEAEARVITLHKQGVNRDAIRERLGVSKDYVGQILRKHGLSQPTGPRAKWTAERITFAVERWLAGDSASQIAEQLGGGVSRNAIIGQLHRQGVKRPEEISQRNREIARKQSAEKLAKPKREPKPKREKPEKPELTVINGDGLASVRVGANGHVITMQPSAKLPKFPGATSKSRPKVWTERRFGECSWPVSGEGAETFSCSAPVMKDRSWCRDHERVGRSSFGGKGYSQNPEAYIAQIIRRCA